MAKSDYALCEYCDSKAIYDGDGDIDLPVFHHDCLAAHDREVRAAALREAAEECAGSAYGPRAWLHALADRIESGSES